MNIFSNYTDKETFAKIVDYSSVSEMWEHSVKTYGNNIAVVYDNPITYSALNEEVGKLRTTLFEKGIKKGDRVGICMPNSLAFIRTFLAITTIGGVAVLLPAGLDNMTILGCSLKFQLKGLVYYSGFEEKIQLTKEKNPILTVFDENLIGDKFTPSAIVSEDDPCAIMFTGGTTGKNKGALLSNRAIMRGTKNGCYGVKEVFEQRYLLVLPLTHVFGLIRNMLTCLYTGSAVYICKNNKDMFKDIAIFKPTVLVFVPALAEMALNLSKKFNRNMLGEDLKYIICGAANVPHYLIEEYKKTGVTLLPGYGLTESANLVSGNPEPLKYPNSVGYMYEGMEYRIVEGELWLKGPNMMDCYVGEPQENELSYQDGWFKTGDLVRMSEEGLLYIEGRKKEIIVLPSGENISPNALEIKFGELNLVQDCLVYDKVENGRTILVLEVLPRATLMGELKVEDKISYLKDELQKINCTLQPYEKINKIIIRDKDFIRSPSMKIVRNQNAEK